MTQSGRRPPATISRLSRVIVSDSGSRSAHDLSYIDVGLRLGAAALAGGMIGINRDLADRPIGTRTLGLVALGAAGVAVGTIQVPGMAENPDAMSRVVQGIVQGVMAGISFIARA
jgi:putative Mg2+ transporter-C (MgtC) family protein